MVHQDSDYTPSMAHTREYSLKACAWRFEVRIATVLSLLEIATRHKL
jgi:hypothetical protein